MGESERRTLVQAALTAEAFGKLLLFLDSDHDRAGEKYEDLRRTLIRFFEWRGAPFPEEHADEAFDRVARKLGAGVEIKNVGGYCYEVARVVYLETTKGFHSKKEPLSSIEFELAAADKAEENAEKEARLACLEGCLQTLPQDNAELILAYYRYAEGGKIEGRKTLAKRFGLRRDALANRAQRVRDKLQECVSGCVSRKQSI